MALALGKRSIFDAYEEEKPPSIEKKTRPTPCNIPPTQCFFDFHRNLHKLSLLFPTMEPNQLNQVLSSTENNLEESIRLLNNLSLSSDAPSRYAQELVTRFRSVHTTEEAIQVAEHAFRTFQQETLNKTNTDLALENSELRQEVQMLKTRLEQVLGDSALLKKAILKLKDHAAEASKKEEENKQLREELTQEKMNSYALRVHLEQALGARGQENRGWDIC